MAFVKVDCCIKLDKLNTLDEDGNYIIAPLIRREIEDKEDIYSYMSFSLLTARDIYEATLIYKDYCAITGKSLAGYIIGEVSKIDSEANLLYASIGIEAEETETEGANEYVVCLACGGEMGAPEYEYRDFQIIKASSDFEAVSVYNSLNSCNYFYGRLVGSVDRLATEQLDIEEECPLFTKILANTPDSKIIEALDKTNKKFQKPNVFRRIIEKILPKRITVITIK